MGNPIKPLTPDEAAKAEARVLKESYPHRALVGLDQFVNVLTGGTPDETISSRWARAAERGSKLGKLGCKFLNLFQSNHGPRAQAGDIARATKVEKLERDSGGFTE